MPPVVTSPWEFARLLNSDGTYLSVVAVFDNASRIIDRLVITNGSPTPARLIITDRTDGGQDVYTLPAGETSVRRQPQLTKRRISTIEELQASPFDISTG